MELDVVSLARDLVAIRSVSQQSNAAVSDLLQDVFAGAGFTVERLEFVDANSERKVSLVACRGEGPDGFGFFSHSDTVPGANWDRDPWEPLVADGRLVGLGACDMKGPLAATIVAAAGVAAADLRCPVFVVVTADEEITGLGARQVTRESRLFRDQGPRHGVVAEPTRLLPVNAHKGSGRVIVTAHGVAAHTSTELGTSANFLIAPFLAEMAELAKRLRTDPAFHNPDFDPPSLGFNMVLDDGGCRPNVTAAKTVCTLSLRPMPNDRSAEVIAMIANRARAHGLEVSTRAVQALHVSPDADVVRAALAATGSDRPHTVPFGTDGLVFKDYVDLVVLGPGDIAQAHTNGEWIELSQLHRAVDVYARMIAQLCT